MSFMNLGLSLLLSYKFRPLATVGFVDELSLSCPFSAEFQNQTRSLCMQFTMPLSASYLSYYSSFYPETSTLEDNS